MTDQRMTKDVLCELRTLHQEICTSDGGECDMMALVRRGADEIEQLRGNLSLAEEGLASAMQEIERLREVLTIPLITPATTTSSALFIRVLSEHEKGRPVNGQDLINALMWRVGNQRREIARLQAKRGENEPDVQCPDTPLGRALSRDNPQTDIVNNALRKIGSQTEPGAASSGLFCHDWHEVSSGELRASREPLPPDVLADAHQDVVHHDTGAVRAGRSVKHESLDFEAIREDYQNLTGVCPLPGPTGKTREPPHCPFERPSELEHAFRENAAIVESALRKIEAQLGDDLMIFGSAFAKRNHDGSIERVDPKDVYIRSPEKSGR